MELSYMHQEHIVQHAQRGYRRTAITWSTLNIESIHRSPANALSRPNLYVQLLQCLMVLR